MMRRNRIVNDFLRSDRDMPIHVIYQQLIGTPTEYDDMIAIFSQVKDDYAQRIAMEYFYANGFFSELKVILEKNKNSSSRTNQKMARIYQILYERKTNNKKRATNPAKYLQVVNRMKIPENEYELHILRDLLHIYCYFDMNQYGKMGTYNTHIKKLLQHIKDPLLHHLFAMRLDETLFIYHWKRNELILTRRYGFKLLKEIKNPYKKIDIHNLLAQSYLFDSYDQAYYHVTEAIALAEELHYERGIYGLRNYTLPFIAAYHGRTDGITTEDKAEQAHIALAENNPTLCVRILEGFENLTPFQQYYLGKAKQNKMLLRTAYQRFVEERDDYFYARLPLEELNTLDQ